MVAVIIGTILTLAAAFWVFTDSRRRGTEIILTMLWVFGVLVFPIIALPLYLFFGRKNKAPVAPPEIPASVINVDAETLGNTIKCPMCAGVANEDYKICPHCGYTLKPECKNCGRKLDRQWAECPTCQTPAEEK